MAIRLSGMASGLDTDTIVKELVSAYSTRKDNIVKKQTKLEWTQDAWKDMNTKIYSFYSKKLSSMRFSGSYSKKTSSVSDSTVAKVTASSTAVNGTQKLKVKQLATSGYLTGGVITDKDGNSLKSSSKLSEVKGLENLTELGNIEVKSGEKTTSIALSGDMTIAQLVAKMKDAGVNASFDEKNQRFFISAKTSGLEGDFALNAGTSDAITALKKLGIYAVTDAEVAKYQKDAAIDIDTETDKAYEAKKTAYTDAATEEKKLQEMVASLDKDIASLSSRQEYLDAKLKYLEMDYDITYEETYDQEGNKILDESGNPVMREVVNYKTPTTKDDKLASVKAEMETMQEELDELNGKSGELSEGEQMRKASLENQLKAAKDAVTILENGVYVASDMKAAAETARKELDEVNKSLTESQGKHASALDALSTPEKLDAYVAERNAEIDTANAELKDNLRDYYTNLKATAENVLNTYKTDADAKAAVRIVGQDSEIELNGAKFTSNTNSYEINGLTIQATALTQGDEAVTITTDTDIDGIYNMIKDFFKDYNELIKSMDEAYNATSASGYEPLTDEEKESMTDDQIEKWEQKIKDALLRKDSTLGTLSSEMKTIMSRSYEVNGEKLSLASFGIKTAGYFASGDNEKGVYHIAGDPDDSTTSDSTDKLRAAIASDPDQVVEFFSQLSSDLYSKLTDRMASSTLSSAYTVYNDKQMKTQYSNYTSDISDWEDKISDYEDRYYKKFAAMEKALASLNSQTSQLSGLFG